MTSGNPLAGRQPCPRTPVINAEGATSQLLAGVAGLRVVETSQLYKGDQEFHWERRRRNPRGLFQLPGPESGEKGPLEGAFTAAPWTGSDHHR